MRIVQGTETGVVRAALLLAAGTASLTGERLAAAGLQVRAGPWLALLGATRDVRPTLSDAVRRMRTRLAPLGHTVVGTQLGRALKRRTRSLTWLLLEARLDRWEALGAAEVAAGRTLVGRLVDDTVGHVLGKVAASPELEATVHRASATLAETTLEEARARSMRADTAAERLVRRVLGTRDE